MANYYEAFDDGFKAGKKSGLAKGYDEGYARGYAAAKSEQPPEPVVPPDGSAEHPYLIKTVADLEQLRVDVADGDCKEGVHFLQAADIDMSGNPWSGIGLMSSATPKYDPDPDHMFKGTYDGGGHVIDHLVLHCESTDTGKANRYKALFRTAGRGATIKNLTVNVDGVDHWESEDIMAAAFVGCTEGPLTIENCTANGTLGTASQPLDNSAGVVCRIAVANNSSPTTTLTNVTNNVDVFGICKVGGIVAYAYGALNLSNVVNNGNMTRTAGSAPTADHYTRDDGVGGIVGYGHQGGAHVTYSFDGVKNAGAISDDKTTYAYLTGQLVGKWAAMDMSSSGDIAVQDGAVPLAKACPITGQNSVMTGAPIFLGEVGADGCLHGVDGLENGKSYVYMVGSISETSGAAVAQPAYVLAAGATVVVDQRFGVPNIVPEAGASLDEDHTLGDDKVRYTAAANV